MIYNIANDVIASIHCRKKIMFFGSNFQDEYNENPLFCNYECSTKNVMQFLQLLPLLFQEFWSHISFKI